MSDIKPPKDFPTDLVEHIISFIPFHIFAVEFEVNDWNYYHRECVLLLMKKGFLIKQLRTPCYSYYPLCERNTLVQILKDNLYSCFVLYYDLKKDKNYYKLDDGLNMLSWLEIDFNLRRRIQTTTYYDWKSLTKRYTIADFLSGFQMEYLQKNAKIKKLLKTIEVDCQDEFLDYKSILKYFKQHIENLATPYKQWEW